MVTEKMYSTFQYVAEAQKALWSAHVMVLGEASSYAAEHQPTFDGLIAIAHAMESSAFFAESAFHGSDESSLPSEIDEDYRFPVWKLLAKATNVVFPLIAAKDVVTTGLQLLFHMQSIQDARQCRDWITKALLKHSEQSGEKDVHKLSVRFDQPEKKDEKDFPFLLMLDVSIGMLEAFMKKDHR